MSFLPIRRVMTNLNAYFTSSEKTCLLMNLLVFQNHNCCWLTSLLRSTSTTQRISKSTIAKTWLWNSSPNGLYRGSYCCQCRPLHNDRRPRCTYTNFLYITTMVQISLWKNFVVSFRKISCFKITSELHLIRCPKKLTRELRLVRCPKKLTRDFVSCKVP